MSGFGALKRNISLTLITRNGYEPPYTFPCAYRHMLTLGRHCLFPGFLIEAQLLAIEASHLPFRVYLDTARSSFKSFLNLELPWNSEAVLSLPWWTITYSRTTTVDFVVPSTYRYHHAVVVHSLSEVYNLPVLNPFSRGVWICLGMCLFFVMAVILSARDLFSGQESPFARFSANPYKILTILQTWYNLHFASRTLSSTAKLRSLSCLVLLWSGCSFVAINLYKTRFMRNLTPKLIPDLSSFTTRKSIATMIKLHGYRPLTDNKATVTYRWVTQERSMAQALRRYPARELGTRAAALAAAGQQKGNVVIGISDSTSLYYAKDRNLHLVGLTSSVPYFVSMMLRPKGHPVIRQLNGAFGHLVENGLIRYLHHKYRFQQPAPTVMLNVNHGFAQTLHAMENVFGFCGWLFVASGALAIFERSRLL